MGIPADPTVRGLLEDDHRLLTDVSTGGGRLDDGDFPFQVSFLDMIL